MRGRSIMGGIGVDGCEGCLQATWPCTSWLDHRPPIPSGSAVSEWDSITNDRSKICDSLRTAPADDKVLLLPPPTSCLPILAVAMGITRQCTWPDQFTSNRQRCL